MLNDICEHSWTFQVQKKKLIKKASTVAVFVEDFFCILLHYMYPSITISKKLEKKNDCNVKFRAPQCTKVVLQNYKKKLVSMLQ